MGKVCAIKSCPSRRRLKNKTSENPQSPSFFKPTTPARLESWKASLGIALKATDVICHLHFRENEVKMYEKMYIEGDLKIIPMANKVLKDNAVPTIEHQFIPTSDEIRGSIINVQKTSKTAEIHSEDEDEQDALLDPKSQINLKDPLSIQLVDKGLQNVQDSEGPTQTMETFKDMIQKFSILPQFWLYTENSNGLEFMRMDPTIKQIRNHIRLNNDLSITVLLSNNEEVLLKEKINSFENIYNYLKRVEKWPKCVGVQIEGTKFSETCKGVIVGDDTYKKFQPHPRCLPCRILRQRLQSISLRQNKTATEHAVSLNRFKKKYSNESESD